jgi:hypothetical protein
VAFQVFAQSLRVNILEVLLPTGEHGIAFPPTCATNFRCQVARFRVLNYFCGFIEPIRTTSGTAGRFSMFVSAHKPANHHKHMLGRIQYQLSIPGVCVLIKEVRAFR